MEVDYLVLADAAAVADGKHYIHGAGWDSLFAVAYPIFHPSMGVALRLRVPWTSTNHPHKVELDVLDADGNSILPDPPGPMQGEINVGRPAQARPGSDQYLCLAFTLVGLQFQRQGTYVVQVRIEGFDSARTTFNVQPPPGIPAQVAQ